MEFQLVHTVTESSVFKDYVWPAVSSLVTIFSEWHVGRRFINACDAYTIGCSFCQMCVCVWVWVVL